MSTNSVVNLAGNFIQSLLPSARVSGSANASPFAEVLSSARTAAQSASPIGNESLAGELAQLSGSPHRSHHTGSSGANGPAGSLNQLFESLTSQAGLSASNAFNAQSIASETNPGTGV